MNAHVVRDEVVRARNRSGRTPALFRPRRWKRSHPNELRRRRVVRLPAVPMRSQVCAVSHGIVRRPTFRLVSRGRPIRSAISAQDRSPFAFARSSHASVGMRSLQRAGAFGGGAECGRVLLPLPKMPMWSANARTEAGSMMSTCHAGRRSPRYLTARAREPGHHAEAEQQVLHLPCEAFA